MNQNGADGLVSTPKPSKLLTVLLPLVLVVAGCIAIWSRIGTENKPTASESRQGMRVDGQWQTAYMNPDGTQVNGIMLLKQKGDTIEGWGTDPKSTFQVTGNLARNQQGKAQIKFSKQYTRSDKQPLGKPIVYFGVIDGINPDGPYFLHISGLWKIQKASGNGRVEMTGKWEAALTEPRSDQSREPEAVPKHKGKKLVQQCS